MIDRLFVVADRQRERRDEAAAERLLRASRSVADGEPYTARAAERHGDRTTDADHTRSDGLRPAIREGGRAVLAAMTPERGLIDRVRTDDPCLPAGRPC